MLARATDRARAHRAAAARHRRHRGTFYTQVLFADFELQAHRLVEQGRADHGRRAERASTSSAAQGVLRRRASTTTTLSPHHVGAHSALLQHAVLRLPVRDVLRVGGQARAARSRTAAEAARDAALARYLDLLGVGRQRSSDDAAAARRRRSEPAGDRAGRRRSAGSAGRAASRPTWRRNRSGRVEMSVIPSIDDSSVSDCRGRSGAIEYRKRSRHGVIALTRMSPDATLLSSGRRNRRQIRHDLFLLSDRCTLWDFSTSSSRCPAGSTRTPPFASKPCASWTTPPTLAALAETDPDAKVRRAAIGRVDDIAVLGRIADGGCRRRNPGPRGRSAARHGARRRPPTRRPPWRRYGGDRRPAPAVDGRQERRRTPKCARTRSARIDRRAGARRRRAARQGEAPRRPPRSGG